MKLACTLIAATVLAGPALAQTTADPPGTAVGRALDQALGTNNTGTNPGAGGRDGTPGNPLGTAAGRAVDRTLGTNSTGTNPTGTDITGTPRR